MVKTIAVYVGLVSVAIFFAVASMVLFTSTYASSETIPLITDGITITQVDDNLYRLVDKELGIACYGHRVENWGYYWSDNLACAKYCQ